MKSTKSKEYENIPLKPWLGFCYFHLGDFPKAMEVYKDILSDPSASPEYHLYLACCLLFMGMYKEAQEEAMLGPEQTFFRLHASLSCRTCMSTAVSHFV